MVCFRYTIASTLNKGDKKDDDDNNKNSAHVGCENNSDTSNNMANGNISKFTQTVPEQHTRKA